MKVLPSTWVFLYKKSLDGSVRKLKASFCVRGDKRVGHKLDNSSPYADIVSDSWSSNQAS